MNYDRKGWDGCSILIFNGLIKNLVWNIEHCFTNEHWRSLEEKNNFIDKSTKFIEWIDIINIDYKIGIIIDALNFMISNWR